MTTTNKAPGNVMDTLDRARLTDAIATVTRDWIGAGRVPDARSIGDGHCYRFASAVVKALGLEFDAVERGDEPLRILDTRDFEIEGDDFVADLDAIAATGESVPDDIPSEDLASLLGAAQHQWFGLDGLYFDASCPGGTKRFLDMPFFADQIEGLRQELAGTPSVSGP